MLIIEIHVVTWSDTDICCRVGALPHSCIGKCSGKCAIETVAAPKCVLYSLPELIVICESGKNVTATCA